MPRKRALVDLSLEEWARTRRELLGLSQPQTAREYLGAVRCTLGERRDLHAGARSEGHIAQHFPEVYIGESLTINMAVRSMSEDLRTIADVHYAVAWPRSRTLRARMLGLSVRCYWDRVGRVKDYVEGFLAASSGERA